MRGESLHCSRNGDKARLQDAAFAEPGPEESIGGNTVENTETDPGRARRLANLRPPWSKGVSGNPNGRPKKLTNLLDKLIDAQDPNDPNGRTYGELAVLGQLKAAAEG